MANVSNVDLDAGLIARFNMVRLKNGQSVTEAARQTGINYWTLRRLLDGAGKKRVRDYIIGKVERYVAQQGKNDEEKDEQ